MGGLERGFKANKDDLSERLGFSEPRTAKELIRQEAFLKKYYQNKKPSESAENYIRVLFGLRDKRVNHHGFDGMDYSFNPPINYEIKSAIENVLIPNTQFYHEDDVRHYLIAVKREDNLETYEFVKRHGKKKKILRNLKLEDLLLLDFGDLFVLPMEAVKEHYILQIAKKIIKEKIHLIGKKYKDLHSLNSFAMNESKKELGEIIERQRKGGSINDDERIFATLTFAQAAQIVIRYGDHHRALIRSKTFKKDYYSKVIDGPNYNQGKTSRIFLMDYDDKVINEIASRITEKRVHMMNGVKKKRAEFYEEVKEKSKEFLFEIQDDKKLMEKILSLISWKNYEENLFSQ